MKVLLEPYNPKWIPLFQLQKERIVRALAEFSPVIEHIGSTALPGIMAKPIIDILVGVSEEELPHVVKPMKAEGFVYVSKFEKDMPYRKFFVDANVAEEEIGPDDYRKFGVDIHSTANIHVIPSDSVHFLRHIAFRDYLRAHEDIKMQYNRLKQDIVKQDMEDHNHYNSYKNEFVKSVESDALAWYFQQ